MFLYATYDSCVQQQSVRLNEYLPPPATRRFGITSPRRNEKTLKCGRNSPRYVFANLMSMQSRRWSILFCQFLNLPNPIGFLDERYFEL